MLHPPGRDAVPFSVEVVPRPEDFDHLGHLNNVSTARLLFEARIRYLTAGVGWNGREGLAPHESIVVREVQIRYDGEAFPGEPLQCSVRAVARSRRAVVLEQVLTKAGGAVVATCRCVQVAADRQAQQAVEIPAALWQRIERFEGGPLPVAGAARDVAGAPQAGGSPSGPSAPAAASSATPPPS